MNVNRLILIPHQKSLLYTCKTWGGNMHKVCHNMHHLVCSNFDPWLLWQQNLHTYNSTKSWKYVQYRVWKIFPMPKFSLHLLKKKIMLFHPKLSLWLFKLVQVRDSAPMISPNHIYQIPYQTNTISTTNKKS